MYGNDSAAGLTENYFPQGTEFIMINELRTLPDNYTFEYEGFQINYNFPYWSVVPLPPVE